MKIGLYFGSYNPIHIGHLIIGSHVANHTDIQQVWMVVSPQNPLKPSSILLNEYHRLHLVKLAVGEDPQLKASDVEFKLPRPSYTIDTLTYLHEKHPKKEFVLIGGGDMLTSLHKCKNYQALLDQYKLYHYPRPGAAPTPFDNHPSITFTDTPFIDISSSFIREAIGKGKNMRYFLPEKVWKYIGEMNFYR